MANFQKIQCIKGPFGPLVVYKGATKNAFYVGPEEYLESALFKDCIQCRAQFRVLRIISHTIFTAGNAYRLGPGKEVPECLYAFVAEDGKLSEIVATGERGINWEYEKIRHIVRILDYQQVTSDCLDKEERALSTCFLIKGVEQRMFDDQTRETYLLEVHTRCSSDDPEYSVRYYDLPLGLVSNITRL